MTKSSTYRIHAESSSKDEAVPEIDYVNDPAMKAEIEAAVGFLTDFLVKAPKQEFSSESVDRFRRSLQSQLYRHYQGHWHSATPFKGSGFRCLRINGKLDPLVARAAEASRLPLRKVRQAFPAELTVWVDPGEVSVRFGEEGSIGVWYSARRTGDEEEHAKKQLFDSNRSYRSNTPPGGGMMYRRQSPSTLSTTPPGGGMMYRPNYHASPVHYPRQQSSPVWSPQWAPSQHNRSSPSSFVTSSGSNGFAMALNHQQQQQMQMRPMVRYNGTPQSNRVSPQPTNPESTNVENSEEQRCKMLAERLMRENLSLMTGITPGFASPRPQPVGVGVN